MEQSHQTWGILEKIGEGGQSSVYKGHWCGRRVAVKMLDLPSPEARARFEREIKIMKILHGKVPDRFIEVIHRVVIDDCPSFAMPLFEQGSLDKRIEPPLIPEKALAFIAAIVELLEIAHKLHIIHNDLKPANILLDDEGGVCIADWGLAFLPSDQKLTQVGVSIGTPFYCDPEIENDKSVRQKPIADIYCLGKMLEEWSAPHEGIRNLVDLMIGRNPGERIQNCEELLSYISQVREMIKQQTIWQLHFVTEEEQREKAREQRELAKNQNLLLIVKVSMVILVVVAKNLKEKKDKEERGKKKEDIKNEDKKK